MLYRHRILLWHVALTFTATVFALVQGEAQAQVYSGKETYPRVDVSLSHSDPTSCGAVCPAFPGNKVPIVGLYSEGRHAVIGFGRYSASCVLGSGSFTCRSISVGVSEPLSGTVTSSKGQDFVICDNRPLMDSFSVRSSYSNGHVYDIYVSDIQYSTGTCSNLPISLHLESSGDSLGIVSNFTFDWSTFPQLNGYTEARTYTSSGGPYTRTGGVGLTITVTNIVYKLGIPESWVVTTTGAVDTTFPVLSSVVAEEPSVPTDYRLMQNFPNPFNSGTTIRFSLDSPTLVHLSVYNILGRNVATILNRIIPDGQHQVRWDGRDSHGKDVPSGVYFYRLTADGLLETRKMLLMR